VVQGRRRDGFNIMPPVLAVPVDACIAEVVSLQRGGLFHTEGVTLRAHYGLARSRLARAHLSAIRRRTRGFLGSPTLRARRIS
jgi:hypothetical protein